MKALSGGETLVRGISDYVHVQKNPRFMDDKDVEGFSSVVIHSCILSIIGRNNKRLQIPYLYYTKTLLAKCKTRMLTIEVGEAEIPSVTPPFG